MTQVNPSPTNDMEKKEQIKPSSCHCQKPHLVGIPCDFCGFTQPPQEWEEEFDNRFNFLEDGFCSKSELKSFIQKEMDAQEEYLGKYWHRHEVVELERQKGEIMKTLQSKIDRLTIE